MEVINLSIQGLKLITLKKFEDDRGYFVERYQSHKFKDSGLPYEFVQDNVSRSKPGVIRGLHFQTNPSQGKLVGVIKGAIWDVAVDLRRQSETYGKWFATELSDQNQKLLWIPAGFAHGFCVLGSEYADVMYKVDAPYSPATEGGVRYDHALLNIPWPVSNPILSAKDLKLESSYLPEL